MWEEEEALGRCSPLPPTGVCLRLEVNGYTEIEITLLHEIAGIDTLIEYTVAAGYFGIASQVLRHREDIVGFTPNGKSLQPAQRKRQAVGETHLLQLEIGAVFDRCSPIRRWWKPSRGEHRSDDRRNASG